MIDNNPGFIIYEVNKPFPRKVHQEEGGKLHIDGDGSLMYLLQLPNLKQRERESFHSGFRSYGYLESGTTPPVAFWIWNWTPPLSHSDANFDAVIADKIAIEEYLKEAEDGGVKNRIIFFLLDRQILKGMKVIALDTEAVLMFHSTIRKQLELNRPMSDFMFALDAMYNFTTNELYAMSKKFQMQERP